ncbi:MAG TPA: hypothetical protein VFO79_12405, partial [Xanthomonadales bacterium]|nr:hypothetical protein [Xanthomonadales bacterium]
ERAVAPGLRDRAACATAVAPNAADTVPDRVRVALLATPFVAGTLAAGALTALLVATLVARGHGIERAAWVLACFGLLQLPGRIWLARGRGAAAPSALVVVPGLLEAAGLAVFAFAQTLPGAFAGVALFALGAGMHTLARPWLVPALFGVAASGRVNGSIARAQGYARAAAPFAGAAAIDAWGAPSAFVALAALLLLALPFGRAGLAGARA